MLYAVGSLRVEKIMVANIVLSVPLYLELPRHRQSREKVSYFVYCYVQIVGN